MRDMPGRYEHSTDRRRIALHDRLRRLKALAVGGTVALALAMWALVSGAVAATTAPPTSTATTTITAPVVTINGNNGFFNGGSSLGSGSAQRPVARSRGS